VSPGILWLFLLAGDGGPAPAAVRECSVTVPLAVVFDIGKATLRPTSLALLDRLAVFLRDPAQAHLRAEIQVHTDPRGDESYRSARPTQQRARSVMRYLVERAGIPPGRLTAKGFGSTRPLVPNDTAAGRARNRRTEVLLVDPSGVCTGLQKRLQDSLTAQPPDR
jgi:outer membrane protein OmpA-like peptidoglycan-associated protein